ncbi:MAG: PAS domain S-box protein [Rhodobiaceae bacterium]|nr:PAS domain S-box protein [Rhodobiaceae bacterium]MCC0055057.1 PAS domain S-box protein [Rhodobiaceae bacterium]
MPTSENDAVSKARLASVLDTAVQGIIVIDQRGKILVYNKACEAMFGYTAEDALGQNVRMIMTAADREAHDTYISDYLDTGERKIIGIGRAVEGRHKDGTEFPLELSVGEAGTPDGRQFIGILRDLREQRASETRIKELQDQLIHIARVNALDEMGAALAHELNQPLTALTLYLQAGLRALDRSSSEASAQAVLREICDKALRESGRAGDIIQRIRRFVEKRETEKRPVSLATTAREATEFANIGKLSQKVEWHGEVEPDLPDVLVDPVQIQQIIVNLVRNALEAVAGKQRRIIRTRIFRSGDRVVYSICDNGPGIAPEIIPDLFHAFATSKSNGMGLGLAISRSIAQNHGGELEVEPGGNGRGATFSLYLPAAGNSA